MVEKFDQTTVDQVVRINCFKGVMATCVTYGREQILNTLLSYLSLQPVQQSPVNSENVIASETTDTSANFEINSTDSKIKQATFSGFSVAQKIPAISKEVDTTNIGNQHVQNNILNAKPVDSDTCISNEGSKKSIKIHQCKISHKRLNGRFCLKRHMRTHTGEKPFKCEQCDLKFNRKSNLKRHMRTHTGEKPFKCEQCDKKFIQKDNLKNHMLTHSGEKPFKCEQCDKKFIQKGNLKYHMFTHSGEKPFKCEQCDKKFIQKGNLKTHILTHTGGKPFECEQCDKKFNWKSSMKRHMRTHTGEMA